MWLHSTSGAVAHLKEGKRKKSARRLDRIAIELAELVADEVGSSEFVAIMGAVAEIMDEPPGRIK